MSTFIAKADYGTQIKDHILDRITNFTDALLDVAEEIAISEVKGYLNARYDVSEIFNKTGANRHPKVLAICVDLALYELHKRINPIKIPEHRKESYEMAILWLKQVNVGKINPPDLPIPADGQKDYLLWGSNTKRTNHIQP